MTLLRMAQQHLSACLEKLFTWLLIFDWLASAPLLSSPKPKSHTLTMNFYALLLLFATLTSAARPSKTFDWGKINTSAPFEDYMNFKLAFLEYGKDETKLALHEDTIRRGHRFLGKLIASMAGGMDVERLQEVLEEILLKDNPKIDTSRLQTSAPAKPKDHLDKMAVLNYLEKLYEMIVKGKVETDFPKEQEDNKETVNVAIATQPKFTTLRKTAAAPPAPAAPKTFKIKVDGKEYEVGEPQNLQTVQNSSPQLVAMEAREAELKAREKQMAENRERYYAEREQREAFQGWKPTSWQPQERKQRVPIVTQKPEKEDEDQRQISLFLQKHSQQQPQNSNQSQQPQKKVDDLEEGFEFAGWRPTPEYLKAIEKAQGKGEECIMTHYFALTHSNIFKVMPDGSLGMFDDSVGIKMLLDGNRLVLGSKINLENYRKRLEQFVKLHNAYHAPLFISKAGRIVHNEHPFNTLSPILKPLGPLEAILDLMAQGKIKIDEDGSISGEKPLEDVPAWISLYAVDHDIAPSSLDPKDELNEGRSEAKRDMQYQAVQQSQKKGIVGTAKQGIVSTYNYAKKWWWG